MPDIAEKEVNSPEAEKQAPAEPEKKAPDEPDNQAPENPDKSGKRKKKMLYTNNGIVWCVKNSERKCVYVAVY